jgi:hypothetical protein
MSVDYLLHSDGAPQREYARQAAADGVITYSYSTDSFKWIEPESSIRWTSATVTKNPQAADAQQANYIDTIFGFIDSITGVRFQKVEGQRGEIHLNFVPTNVNRRFKGDFTKGVEVDPVINTEYEGGVGFTNGYGQIYSFHNRKQYGALDDIRSIQRTILSTVGITSPNGNGSDPAYSKDNTLMSFNNGSLNSAGATFFLTSDDQSALKAVFGNPSSPPPLGTKTHVQRLKEDLMLGSDGVVDTFRLTAKGMILKQDSGTQYDDLGAILNNYNVPYIANFNGSEGDKILISKKLFTPDSPIDGNKTNKSKAPSKIKIKFLQTFKPEQDTPAWRSSNTVVYNDAGKLVLNVNGKADGLGPDGNGGINGQIVSFVDPVGPENSLFQKSWLGLF